MFDIEGSFQCRNNLFYETTWVGGGGGPNKDKETENNTLGPRQSFLAVISETWLDERRAPW